jgi:uncharacterized protein YbcI
VNSNNVAQKTETHGDVLTAISDGTVALLKEFYGRGSAVIQQRMEFQEVMRSRFTGVIEAATGRPVIGFMSGNQQHPDIMCEVFILGPTDLVDEHEM